MMDTKVQDSSTDLRMKRSRKFTDAYAARLYQKHSNLKQDSLPGERYYDNSRHSSQRRIKKIT